MQYVIIHGIAPNPGYTTPLNNYVERIVYAWGEFGCWIGHYAGFTGAGAAV